MSFELCVLIALLIVSAAVVLIVHLVLKHLCAHEWETIEELPVYGESDIRPCAFLYVLKCKKCGEIRQKVVKYEVLTL